MRISSLPSREFIFNVIPFSLGDSSIHEVAVELFDELSLFDLILDPSIFLVSEASDDVAFLACLA